MGKAIAVVAGANEMVLIANITLHHHCTPFYSIQGHVFFGYEILIGHAQWVAKPGSGVGHGAVTYYTITKVMGQIDDGRDIGCAGAPVKQPVPQAVVVGVLHDPLGRKRLADTPCGCRVSLNDILGARFALGIGHVASLVPHTA